MTIKEFTENQLNIFNRDDFRFGSNFREAIDIFAKSAAIPFFLMLFAGYLEGYSWTNGIQRAIDDVLSMDLWNLIGIIGLLFFGLTIIFHKCRLLSKISIFLLLTAYRIGSAIFGVFAAQFILLLPEISNNLEGWRLHFLVIFIFFLMFLAFRMIYLLWCLSSLAQCNSTFRKKLDIVDWKLRIFCGLFLIASSSSVWLIMSKLE
ncbi:hypothetical protein MNBD_GAMMA12-2580 [hydrothermal vent metagenome]|uniref:Uncharacterized protein n=1 Tax=hydrothermal vent metagenome TaxID=652676 RepID=A0A3B0YNH8_9ZZZZ